METQTSADGSIQKSRAVLQWISTLLMQVHPGASLTPAKDMMGWLMVDYPFFFLFFGSRGFEYNFGRVRLSGNKAGR